MVLLVQDITLKVSINHEYSKTLFKGEGEVSVNVYYFFSNNLNTLLAPLIMLHKRNCIQNAGSVALTFIK